MHCVSVCPCLVETMFAYAFCMWLHCFEMLCPEKQIKTASSSSWAASPRFFLLKILCFCLPLSCMPTAPLPSRVPVSGAATPLPLPPLAPPDTVGESVVAAVGFTAQQDHVLPSSPLSADIVKALNHQLDAKWRHFGTFLGVNYQTVESIETSKCGRPDDCMLDLLGRWTSNQAGTGHLPRTWQTVVAAVRETGFGDIAEILAIKHGLNHAEPLPVIKSECR